MNRTTILLISLLMLLPGCQYIRQRHQSGVVAQVGNQVLTRQVLDEATTGLSGEDSARVAEQYIQDWALNILQYEEASAATSERIENMVADYRRSLYRHEYEQQLIARQMPTHVEDSVVEQFYNNHQKQFLLKETILKGILLVFPTGTPKQDKLRKWLDRLDEDNMENIEKFAYQYATGYELFVDEWRTANQVLLRLPTDATTLQQSLRRHALVECQDSTQVYWLQVTDKHFKGDVMPLDYAAPEITNILLSQRRTQFLQDKRRALYEEAVRNKQILRNEP